MLLLENNFKVVKVSTLHCGALRHTLVDLFSFNNMPHYVLFLTYDRTQDCTCTYFQGERNLNTEIQRISSNNIGTVRTVELNKSTLRTTCSTGVTSCSAQLPLIYSGHGGEKD